jgi:hypothetical protein
MSGPPSFVAAVAAIAIWATFAFAAPAPGATSRAAAGTFPGRAYCKLTDFYVDYKKIFAFSPPQVTVFARDKAGNWRLAMYYRYATGLFQYRFAPACPDAHRVRSIKTEGVGVNGHTRFGTYALHCHFTRRLEIQQGWEGGASVLYLADGHTIQGFVQATFTAKKTQLSWNTHVCALMTKDLPIFPTFP